MDREAFSQQKQWLGYGSQSVSFINSLRLISPHSDFVKRHAKSLQSRQTLCDPMDCSPPGSSVHGILQARTLEWAAMPSSRGSPWFRDWPPSLMSPALAGQFFTSRATWEGRDSPVAQTIKNLPSMRETWVWSLGWEDSPAEGNGYSLQYSGLENSMDCIVHGVTKSQTWLSYLNCVKRSQV